MCVGKYTIYLSRQTDRRRWKETEEEGEEGKRESRKKEGKRM